MLVIPISAQTPPTVALNDLGVQKVPGTFIHPGIMHSQDDLDRMRNNITVEPYKTAYSAFASSNYSRFTNTGQGPFTYETYNHGQFEIRNDAAIVHNNAIMWYVTGEPAYRNNAIQIMMKWANTLKAFDVTDHITAATAAFDFTNGAEIIQVTGGGAWAPADVATFQNWLLTYLYPPLLTPGNSIAAETLEAAGHGGLQMKGLISIGVFCERMDIFQFAVASYLHNQHYSYGLQEYIDPRSGQNYETQRDQGHASGNIGTFAQIAYVAWNQGEDLFGTANNLLLKATEYQAKLDLLYDVKPVLWSTPDGGTHDVIAQGARGPIDNLLPDLAYYIYHDQKGLNMPYTEMMANIGFPYAGSNNSFMYRVDKSGHVPLPIDYGDTVSIDVELFGDGNYGGSYLAHFGPGKYTRADLAAAGASDNSASSIKIPAGWSVTLYDQDNFTGPSVTLSGNVSFLGQLGTNFNDRTTSMVVSTTGGAVGGPVLLYTGKQFTGKVASITAGAYSTAQLVALGIPNDALMSIHVPCGYVVYLFNGNSPADVGYNERLIGDSPDVSGDFVSSILVVGQPVTNGNQLADGTYQLAIGTLGQVATIPPHETPGNMRVREFEYSGAFDQLWKVQQTADGNYTFSNLDSGLLMDVDVSRSPGGEGAPVIHSASTGSANQYWNLARTADGAMIVTSAGLGKAVEAPATSVKEGTGLMLRTYTGADTMQWHFLVP